MMVIPGVASAQIPMPVESPARGSQITQPVVSPPPPAPMPDEAAKNFSPRPPAGNAAEIAYRRFADEAIAPILKHDISKDDLARVKSALANIGKGDFEAANAAAAEISDASGRKLIAWYTLISELQNSVERRRPQVAARPALAKR